MLFCARAKRLLRACWHLTPLPMGPMSARGILGEMKAAGCPPDVISYNSVLGALDKAGRPSADRAARLRRDGLTCVLQAAPVLGESLEISAHPPKSSAGLSRVSDRRLASLAKDSLFNFHFHLFCHRLLVSSCVPSEVRLLEDMERSGVKPNNLFLERHIACILGIPQKADGGWRMD